MRIRLKLTILLLVFSLAPLIASEIFDALAFDRLSHRVDQQFTDNISRRIDQELAVNVRRTAEHMSGIRSRVMMMARSQAASFSGVLSGPVPEQSHTHPPFTPEEFGKLTAGEIPPGFREQPGWQPGQTPPVVSYERPLLAIPPGLSIETATDLSLRLAQATDDLQALSDDFRGIVRGQFMGFQNGAFLTFPAQNGYESFEPAAQEWYTLGMNSDDVEWTRPYQDAITGEARMTCVMPVRAPDGTLLGVTGTHVSLSVTTSLLELPPELSLGSAAWVINLQDHGNAHSRVLFAIGSEPNDAGIHPAEAAIVESILAPLRSGNSGSYKLEIDGVPGIAAYGQIAPSVGLVMFVANHRIDGIVGPARQDLREIAHESRRSAIAISVLVVLLSIAGAYAMGRTISRPIRRLADAAQAVSDGDLNARVSIRPRRDELGKLARTFNEMVPALADRMRLQESIGLANQLQIGMLPDAPPSIPGFDVYGIAIYCDETGGDYFDYLLPISLGDHRHGLALGDVTGHGIPAALIMTSARALLLSHARHVKEPHEILNRINETVAERASGGKFMTFTLLVLDTKKRTLEVANAGHDPALILRARDGSFEELPLGGLPLGISPDEKYTTSNERYPEPGDILIIGTDGIWETRDHRGEFYGKERMRQIVRTNAGKSAREIGDAILEDIRTYRGSAPVLDDITFIIAKADGPTA